MALQLGFRILMAIAINSVLCWMVLRSGSLLPPAIAHTLYNVLVIGGFGPAFAWKFKLVIAIWGIVGIILFRYWPVQMTAAQPESPTIASPELAG
jgi:membrane protease YdiL (CAAX protease family)